MVTHSSILAWKIVWTGEPGSVTVHGVAKSQAQLKDLACTHSIYIVTIDTQGRQKVAVQGGRPYKKCKIFTPVMHDPPIQSSAIPGVQREAGL